MKKIESTLPSMVIVLAGVAVIFGGLLAFVNHATEATIQKQDEIALANGIKAVMGAEDIQVTDNTELTQGTGKSDERFVIHHVSDNNGNPIGAAVESTSLGFGGDLNVLVGFDKSGTVLGYTILQHSETPGLGAKADTWFQASGKGSIIGKSLADGYTLSVSKDGGDIDAITASTITSRAFLKAVNAAYAAYAGTDYDATSGATPQAVPQDNDQPK